MRVVNVHGMAPNTPGIVYCGRACGGWPTSPLANPYVLERESDRNKVLSQYRQWLAEQIADGNAEVMVALDDLYDGSVLGCWCSPKPCHCDTIVEFSTLLREGML